MSIVQSSSEFIPYAAGAAAAVGYAAGFGADLLAQSHAAKKTLAANAALGELGATQQPNRSRRIGAAAISGLALMGPALGGSLILGLVDTEGTQNQPPAVEVVADYSYATTLGDGKPAKDVKAFALAISDENNITVEAIIGNNGEPTKGTPDLFNQMTPYGDAVMPAATKAGLDQALAVKSQAVSGDVNKNVGIVVLTNGNSIGAPDNIVATAKLTQTPIYVVNVEGATTNPAVTDEFKTITTESGGQLWNAQDIDPKTVANTVTEGLKNTNTKSPNKSVIPDWLQHGIQATSVLLAAASVQVFRNRSSHKTSLYGSSKLSKEES